MCSLDCSQSESNGRCPAAVRELLLLSRCCRFVRVLVAAERLLHIVGSIPQSAVKVISSILQLTASLLHGILDGRGPVGSGSGSDHRGVRSRCRIAVVRKQVQDRTLALLRRGCILALILRHRRRVRIVESICCSSCSIWADPIRQSNRRPARRSSSLKDWDGRRPPRPTPSRSAGMPTPSRSLAMSDPGSEPSA